MKSILSTILFLILNFLTAGNALAAFTGPAIPQAIPFTQNGKTYGAYVQAWHPYYGQSQICYYPTDFNQAYAPIIAKSDVVYGGLVNIRLHLNPASSSQAWDSEAYYTTNLLCARYQNGNWVSSPTTPDNLLNGQYNWGDWYFLDHDAYGLTDDLVRAVGINIKVNATYDFSGQFGLGSYTSGDVMVAGSAAPSYLSFPLAGQTAYTAEVSSVMDQGTLGTGSTYGSERNGTVSIFNGESGTATTGCHCYSTGLSCNGSNYSSCAVPGYAKLGGGSWTFTGIINFTATDGKVYYDGHPGYDYPKAQGTAILSPASGTLCVATTVTSKPTPSAVWRNTTNCGSIPSVITERWQTSGGHNAFYILHGSMLMNGSTDEYMTVFLHSNNLESTVLAGIYDDGYKTVTRLQEIAAVGDIGAPGAYHVHLEVYKKVSGTWNRVDPYGNGTSNLLWPKPY